METFYLCKNCIKPLRIKIGFESDIRNSDQNVGECVICGKNGIDISLRPDILQNITDCIRFYYPIYKYFRKSFPMPICMYFPDILNPYIFEEDNTILEKPLDI